MATVKAELATFQSQRDLKALLSCEGPCISVYLPLSNASTAGLNPNLKQNDLRWRDLVRNLEQRAKDQGPAARDQVDSLGSWELAVPDQEGLQARSVAIFRSKDVFSAVPIDFEVPERAEIGPHFYIRPLLPQLIRPNAFYLLALSQKNVRLLRCTNHTSEEVALPDGVPKSFDAFMDMAKPDHNTENRVSPGPAAGTSKGVMFSTSSDRDDHPEYLSHFFRRIDQGIAQILKGRTEPLVLCAVEYEQPLYRAVNDYPYLLQEGVYGAPNSLKSGEMHARALEVLQRECEAQAAKALAEWNHKVGASASSRLKDVVTAAHDGRILTLVVSDRQEKTGVFQEEAHRVVGRETGTASDEDLVNDAVVQTILHGGNVLVAQHSKMPNGQPMAAIFRYQVATA